MRIELHPGGFGAGYHLCYICRSFYVQVLQVMFHVVDEKGNHKGDCCYYCYHNDISESIINQSEKWEEEGMKLLKYAAKLRNRAHEISEKDIEKVSIEEVEEEERKIAEEIG